MAKPDRMTWHDYISESPYVSFQNSSDYERYMRISQCLQKIQSLYYGDLRSKNVAKRIVKEHTQPIAIAKGHPPFCFRFQCLTTGRKSKYIRECDYGELGITKDDCSTGAGYDYVSVIPDKFAGVIPRLCSDLQAIYAKCVSGSSWWSRYDEYLQSEDWFQTRLAVLARDGFACVISKETSRLHVHHLTYENVGMEQLSDLVTLCESVHFAVHNPSDRNYSKYNAFLKGGTHARSTAR